MKIGTLKMIELMKNNPSLQFRTVANGKEIIAFINSKGGISIGRENLSLSSKIINAKWEIHNKPYSFMQAINSNKKIKYQSWSTFKAIPEALYDLLDYSTAEVIKAINGDWNIDESI